MNTQQNTLTPKEYLSQAYFLDVRINSKLEQASCWRALATKVTAHISDMPKNQSASSTMENIIVKLVDLEREIDADIDTLIEMKCDIAETIKAVRVEELVILLEMRYLFHRKWTDIAQVLEIDERYVHKLHGKALVYVKNNMPTTKGQ